MASPATQSRHELTHVQTLEAEAIHIIREVAAEFDRPVMLFSGGKGSAGDVGRKLNEALSRQGRFQSVRDDLRVNEVHLDRTPGMRWIVCHIPSALSARLDKWPCSSASAGNRPTSKPRPVLPVRHFEVPLLARFSKVDAVVVAPLGP